MTANPATPSPALAISVPRRRSLISLTPLIDVVFILLVFFMLASSFLDWRSIALNAPARAGTKPTLEGVLLIEVRPDGLRFADLPTTLDDLIASVTERLRDKPDRRVLVKPAAEVPLQATVDLLDRLATAGVSDMSLIRDRTR